MKASPKKKQSKDYSHSTAEPSIKNRTLLSSLRPFTSSVCNKKASNDPMYKSPKADQYSTAPTLNNTKANWRISSPESTSRGKAVSPPSIVNREYSSHKGEIAQDERVLFTKKKLRGKLFHLLQNNFIMDSASYHLMNINTKANLDEKGDFKEIKHGNEYRTKHHIGIVTKKTSDLFNNIPITRRYEDNYHTPQEFVKGNFSSKDIVLFENDPAYFNLGNTPLNQSSVCFKRHLKDKLDAEEAKSNQNKTVSPEKTVRPLSPFLVKRKKVKLMFKISRNTEKQHHADAKAIFHPVEYTNYKAKLETLNASLNQKHSAYQERRDELTDIKTIKLERSKAMRIRRRDKRLQVNDKLKKEQNAITTLVNMLKQNYQESNSKHW